MARYDEALRGFVGQFGEDAVESALDLYANHRERSKKAAQKAKAQKQGLANLVAKAKADPKLAEQLKAAGIQIGG